MNKLKEIWKKSKVSIILTTILLLYFSVLAVIHIPKVNKVEMCYDYGMLNNVNTTYLTAYEICMLKESKLEIHEDLWLR